MTVIINVGSKKRANLRSIKKFLSHIGNKEVNENPTKKSGEVKDWWKSCHSLKLWQPFKNERRIYLSGQMGSSLKIGLQL